MKEEVLKIAVLKPQDWIDKLSELEGVKEAALFGMALHVIVKEAGQATSLIREEFLKAGLKDYSIEKIPASLEDVFVSMIEAYDRAGGICEPEKS